LEAAFDENDLNDMKSTPIKPNAGYDMEEDGDTGNKRTCDVNKKLMFEKVGEGEQAASLEGQYEESAIVVRGNHTWHRLHLYLIHRQERR
jgi:hypothetical protein